jgi:hypothetical protein
LSQTMGAVLLGYSHALNLVVDRAGVPGDYLYRNFIAGGDYAMWGLFRVGPPATDALALTAYDRDSGGATLSGYVTPDLHTQRYAAEVALIGRPDHIPVDQTTGRFQITLRDAPATVTARSANGGEASVALPPEVPAAPAALAARAPPTGARPEAVVRVVHDQQRRMNLQIQKYLPRFTGRRPSPP